MSSFRLFNKNMNASVEMLSNSKRNVEEKGGRDVEVKKYKNKGRVILGNLLSEISKRVNACNRKPLPLIIAR